MHLCERAALTWTESVTQISHDRVPDAVYEEVRAHFGDEELVSLTPGIIVISGWNRRCISFRSVPGEYQRKRPTKCMVDCRCLNCDGLKR